MPDDTPPQDPPTRPTNLHAPWRESWIRHVGEIEKQGGTVGNDPNAKDPNNAASFLRAYWLDPDRDHHNLVIARTGTEAQLAGGMVLLNRYPYVGGHLLVALGDPRPRLLDYTEAQRRELWSLVDLAADLCERVLEPQGMNIGINVGRAGGAGVPQHLHVHVIPRWMGDTNFITAASNVRLVNASLESFHKAYADAWRDIQRDARRD